jgi:hypothetical protein
VLHLGIRVSTRGPLAWAVFVGLLIEYGRCYLASGSLMTSWPNQPHETIHGEVATDSLDAISYSLKREGVISYVVREVVDSMIGSAGAVDC